MHRNIGAQNNGRLAQNDKNRYFSASTGENNRNSSYALKRAVGLLSTDRVQQFST
jgi:hypothetical protein